MAAKRKSQKAPREVRPCVLDIDGYPGAAVYRLGPEDYRPMYMGLFVNERFYETMAQAEEPAIIAWVQAHPECQKAA